MKKRGKKFLFAVIVVLLLLYRIAVVGPTVRTLCTENLHAEIRQAINASNDTLFASELYYSDFFSEKYDGEGNVVSVHTNAGLVNQLSMMWSTEIQNRLDALRSVECKLPAGVYTGSAFLSQFGADVTVNVQSVSVCDVNYKSIFEAKGVNQTLHRFYFIATVKTEIAVPAFCEELYTEETVLVTESVLNGKVPSTFIGPDGTDYLDLLE